MILSILIPAYNRDCTRLVDDLLEQIPQDAEIIVGNDKSTSPEAVMAYQKLAKQKQCRVFEPSENLGRSRILNRLFELSSGKWLLILDADMQIISTDYIKSYLRATTEHPADIYFGGLKNTESCPKGCELRWTYETQIYRRRTTEFRETHPYESLTTTNIMIDRDAFAQTGFREDITKYGYEDIFLLQDMKRRGKKIHHMENRVVHLDIDSNAQFLSKTREALKTLHSLPQETWPQTKLVNTFLFLQKYHIHRMVALLHILLLPLTRRILCSRFVSLNLYQFYKLGYFCGL